MRFLFLANAAGVVAATVYAGFAASSVWIPWYAFAAAAVFIAALAVPWIAEYRSINREFGAIQDDFMTHGRGDKTPKPRQEVFGAGDTAPGFRSSSPPVTWVVVLGLIGAALLAFDVIQWLPLETAPEDDRSLSYF